MSDIGRLYQPIAKKDEEDERNRRDNERAMLLQQQLITAETPVKKKSIKQKLEEAQQKIAEQAEAAPTPQSKIRNRSMHR